MTEEQRRDMKHGLHVWLIIFFLFGIAHILGAQTSDGTTVVHLNAPRLGLVAETTCSDDNKIVIIFHADLDTLEERLTMVHEKVHERQMQGDCKNVQMRYRSDPNVRIYMEQEAYCEDSRARLTAGQSLAWVKRRFRALMKALYDVDDPACPYLPP